VADAHLALAVLVLVAPGELLNLGVALGEFLVGQVRAVAVLRDRAAAGVRPLRWSIGQPPRKSGSPHAVFFAR
jgi:hypothetical protein